REGKSLNQLVREGEPFWGGSHPAGQKRVGFQKPGTLQERRPLPLSVRSQPIRRKPFVQAKGQKPPFQTVLFLRECFAPFDRKFFLNQKGLSVAMKRGEVFPASLGFRIIRVGGRTHSEIPSSRPVVQVMTTTESGKGVV